MPDPVTRQAPGAANCAVCVIRDACMLNRLRSEEAGPAEPQIRERVFHRGDVLLEEGRTAKSIRLVKLGIVFGYRRGLDRRSRPVGIASRGTALGISATYGMPSQASCVALTAVRVCELPVAALRITGACGSAAMAQVGQSVNDMFAALMAWSEAMRLPGVVNQLAYVLVLLADANRSLVVELPSHAALAELLGARRETVARAVRTLENEGGIRRHERRRCEVRRDRLLKRLSQGE